MWFVLIHIETHVGKQTSSSHIPSFVILDLPMLEIEQLSVIGHEIRWNLELNTLSWVAQVQNIIEVIVIRNSAQIKSFYPNFLSF